MKYNKLIAEFMGWDIESPTTLPSNLHLSNLEIDNNEVLEYKFHTSWDWLMPVVIKCKESVDYCDDDNALEYHKIEDEMLSQLSIEDTYQAVVEFIKRHNDEAPTNEPLLYSYLNKPT